MLSINKPLVPPGILYIGQMTIENHFIFRYTSAKGYFQGLGIIFLRFWYQFCKYLHGLVELSIDLNAIILKYSSCRTVPFK
jgi:hypothetical protein